MTVQWLQSCRHRFGRDAKRNVLRAVPVEALDADQQVALDQRIADRRAQPRDQIGIGVGGVDMAGPAHQLEALLLGEVDDDQRHPAVVVEVADRDILPIAAKVRQCQGVVIDRLDEAGRTATVLDVGPAARADGGNEETLATGDEVAFAVAERRRRRALFEPAPDLAATVALLGIDHGGGEGKVGKALHRGVPVLDIPSLAPIAFAINAYWRSTLMRQVE